MLLTKYEFWLQSQTHTLSVIKSASLTSFQVQFVLWCSMQMMETYFKRLHITRRRKHCLAKKQSGKYSLAWWEDSRLCMIWRFFTETWSLRTCFWRNKATRCWETWTWAKWLKRASATRRQAPHTTRAPRSGETSLMALKATFGLLAALFLKWWHSNRRSGPTTCKAFSRKWLREPSRRFRNGIQPTSCRSSERWFRSIQRKDRPATKFWGSLSWRRRLRSSACLTKKSMRELSSATKTISWTQFTSRRN